MSETPLSAERYISQAPESEPMPEMRWPREIVPRNQWAKHGVMWIHRAVESAWRQRRKQ